MAWGGVGGGGCQSCGVDLEIGSDGYFDHTGWEPALPLILAAWHDTAALSKILRLDEHIRWADEQNALDEISTFLRNLPEDHWLHLDE